MDDFILSGQPDWRYCRVRAGEKKPYPADWQKNPLTLDQVDSKNIGVLLGPASGGICAIDFDGPTAFVWAQAQGIKMPPPRTPTWSSGKPGRCQMAFRVPQEAWDVLSTKKISHAQDPMIAVGEGFEFRWTGSQSVLPPSIHPDTGRPYEWWIDALETVADIPDEMLLAWLQWITPRTQASAVPEVRLEDLDEKKVSHVNEILAKVKSRHPVLAYDDWRSIAWGVAKELGRDAGEVVMREYYPEQESGEYRNLYRNYDVAKSPSMGTVIKMFAGITSKKQQHNESYQQYLEDKLKLQQLELKLALMKREVQDEAR